MVYLASLYKLEIVHKVYANMTKELAISVLEKNGFAYARSRKCP